MFFFAPRGRKIRGGNAQRSPGSDVGDHAGVGRHVIVWLAAAGNSGLDCITIPRENSARVLTSLDSSPVNITYADFVIVLRDFVKA